MTTPLHISYDDELDWLEATPFGMVMDRQGHDRWRGVSDTFGFFLDRPGGDAIGFRVVDFSSFDAEAPEVKEIFSGPRFDAPTLGLIGVSAGAIVLAAVPFVDGASTIDRMFFQDAMGSSGEAALGLWLGSLQAGNLMAHYGAGYTLLGLDRPRLAYQHLRFYTELVPADAWAWAYRARAALAMGDPAEARSSCEQAIRAEGEYGEETDAAELLAELG